MNVPHSASIVSHERMDAFAYFSIFDILAKLGIAYLTYIAPIDKLIFYAFLQCLTTFLVFLIYWIYCRKNFVECRYSFIWDKSLMKQMFSFTGWNFIGSTSEVLKDQGGNMGINLFSGPAVNAARGIAMQVNHAVYSFVTNFTTALNPQITKCYAVGDTDNMLKLVFRGARFSFYILLILSVPILVNTEYIIQLWLGKNPEHTCNFIRLILIYSLNEALARPLSTANLATGKIRNYQLSVGIMQLINVPVSYVALKMGAPVEAVFITMIVIGIICVFLRAINLRVYVRFPMKSFVTEVYVNIIIVFFLSMSLPYVAHFFLPENIWGLILSCVVCVCTTIPAILYVGCRRSEREAIVKAVLKKVPILKNRISK